MKLVLVLFFFFNSLFAAESFLPQKMTDKTPVFFVLHGCKQSSKNILADSFLKEKSKGKVAFFAPSQSRLQNIDLCWNWFFPTNTFPTPGNELLNLMNKFRLFITKNKLTKNPKYIMGLSAGSAMSMNIFACYPGYFDGMAIHAGLPYKATDVLWDVNDVVAYGTKKPTYDLARDFTKCGAIFSDIKDKKIIVVHGSRDTRVSINNFYAIEGQLKLGLDLLHDGEMNDSVLIGETSSRIISSSKYPYELRKYFLKNNNQLHFYEVEGLGHEWSGGPYRVERNDPKGPELTDIILKEFR